MLAGTLQQGRDVRFFCQQKTSGIERMRGFFIRKEGQFSQIWCEKIIGIGITAHLGHVHETRISYKDGRILQCLYCQQHPIMPVNVGKEIVEGQAVDLFLLQVWWDCSSQA